MSILLVTKFFLLMLQIISGIGLHWSRMFVFTCSLLILWQIRKSLSRHYKKWLYKSIYSFISMLVNISL